MILRLILIMVILSASFQTACFCEYKWYERKSDHFIVYYKNAPLTLVSKLIERSEYLYTKINEWLGFEQFHFWLWDKRCRIVIFDDFQDYKNKTFFPSWSQAGVDCQQRIIYLHKDIDIEYFLSNSLPHEMSHLIFREFMGKVNLPLFLEEGVATQQEENSQIYKSIVNNMIIQESYLPFERLVSIQTPSELSNKEAVYFYAQSFSVIYFLIRNYGKAKFVEFCSLLRDGVRWDKALQRIYKINSLKELKDEWRRFWSSG